MVEPKKSHSFVKKERDIFSEFTIFLSRCLRKHRRRAFDKMMTIKGIIYDVRMVKGFWTW